MTKVSTMKPFAPGDIFLGCTYLNDPDDDHAGEGRILQYDRNMVPKGTLYTEGTSHLVINLRFGPDGVLWAFDPFEYCVVRVSPDGQQLPAHDFGQRGWGSVCHGNDGRILLMEYLNGDKPYEGGDMRTLPGTNVVGYGANRPLRRGFHAGCGVRHRAVAIADRFSRGHAQCDAPGREDARVHDGPRHARHADGYRHRGAAAGPRELAGRRGIHAQVDDRRGVSQRRHLVAAAPGASSTSSTRTASPGGPCRSTNTATQ